MKEVIKLMLVEDSPEYRHVIDFALQEDPNFELLSQFGAAEQVIRGVQNHESESTPDIILLDLNLPGISGLEALPELARLMPDSKIIVLTQSESSSDVLGAIKNGAAGYLLKSSSVQEIKAGIATVVEGGAPIDPKMALFLLDSLQASDHQDTHKKNLSEREMEILNLVSQGLARKEISVKLDISPKTVANHIAHIFEKMDVPNAPAAVGKAFRTGLLGRD